MRRQRSSMLTRTACWRFRLCFFKQLFKLQVPEASRVASGPGEIACTRMPFGPDGRRAFPDENDRVAEAAAPVLDRLCHRISRPSDLMVPAGDHMEIRETSRTHSPFLIYYNKDRVGIQVNWLLSAVGRA